MALINVNPTRMEMTRLKNVLPPPSAGTSCSKTSAMT